MINALLGQKINQTQKFLENGTRIPVTEILLADNTVLQLKTVEKDMYTAVQLGVGARKNGTKAMLGHSKKANLDRVPRFIREVKLADAVGDLPEAGSIIAIASVFKPGDIVSVTGVSKGKGFAGVVKRHHFRGGPKTHGQSDRWRAPGSIGQTTTPGRVYRGKRMAGHMGVDTVTVQNLTIVAVDEAHKRIYISGLVPGHRNGWLFINRTGENKKFVPLVQTQPIVADIPSETKELETKTEAHKHNEAPQNV